LYFARRCEEVKTVESDVQWECLLDQRLQRAGEAIRKRVSLRLVPVVDRPGDRDGYVDCVHEGAPWDIVLVDGARRLRCVREATSAVKSGGLLILDNADYWRYRKAPSILPRWKRLTFRGLGFGRRWVTQTDIYIAP